MKTIKLTESDIKRIVKSVVNESAWSEEESRPVSFTSEDREMLRRIYDVVVRGGSAGGYGGVRKRAIPALGTLPELQESFDYDDSYLNEQRAFNRSEVDIDVVLELMKYKYGYGDLASGWIEEFEEELGNETLSTINSLEYADLLHRFIQDAEEESRRYDDRINYNSGHVGYDDRNYQYGNKPDDYYGEDENPYLNEQKEYSDNHYDYSPYRGINTTKIEKEIKNAIRTKSHSLSYRNGEKTVTYNDPNLVNPHLEQDIQRLAQRILYNIYHDVRTYVGENYEEEIVNIINGEFD